MLFPFRWGIDGDWGWGVVSAFGSVLSLTILVIPWLFFLLNLQNLLRRVHPSNQAMPPGHVWLNFIPVFSLGWFLYTVMKIRDSVAAEYRSRGWAVEGDQGYNVGLVMGVLAIASFFLGWVPVIGWLIVIAELVCWVLYWLKTHELKGQLGTLAWTHAPGATYKGSRSDAGYSTGSPPYEYWSRQYWPEPQPYVQSRPQPQARAYTQARPGASSQPESQPQSQPQPEPQSQYASDESDAAGGTADRSAGIAREEAAADMREHLCVACGSHYVPGDRFCRVCGLRLPS